MKHAAPASVAVLLACIANGSAVWRASLPVPGAAVDDAPVEDSSDARARALATALLVYDRSICSIEYRFDLLIPGPGSVDDLLMDGVMGFGEDGRWYWRGRRGSRETGGPLEYEDQVFVFDGVEMRSYFESQHSGVRAPEGNDRNTIASYEQWLGRRLCYARQPDSKPLALRLLDGRKLAAQPVPGSAVSWQLCGEIVIEGIWFTIQMELDSSLGFAPVEWTLFHPTLGFPYQKYRADDWRNIDGVWLPMWIERSLFTAGEPSAEQQAQLRDRITDAGLESPIDPRDEHAQSVALKAVTEVFGSGGYPSEALGGGRNLLIVREVLSLNKGLDSERATLAFPLGSIVGSGFDGRVWRMEAEGLVPISEEEAAAAVREARRRHADRSSQLKVSP